MLGNHFARDSYLEIHDGPVNVENNRFDEDSELEVGTDQPGLFDWVGDPVPIPGRIVNNTFDPNANLEMGTCDASVYESLVIFDNRYRGGACMPANGCRESTDVSVGPRSAISR